MTQVPILNGIYTDGAPDFRTSYPRNMVPVPKDQGISKGYLRPAEGIATFATGPGADRGGEVWNGLCYRAMGSQFVRVAADGSVTALGDLAGAGQVRMDYSFDRLAIAAGGRLFYWNGTLTQVTDVDLGAVIDVIWIDGYFMTTDGTSLVVTDLNDATRVNPLRYGSSEADPDSVKRLLKLRAGEVAAVNRYTIELFNNVGGSFFPFERNENAQIGRGAIGTHCAALFVDQIAFLGGARNEPPAVWLGINGGSSKISTREVDTLLQEYTESQLSQSVMDVRVSKSHHLLYLHLPDQTLVYDAAASAAVQEPVWYTLDSGIGPRSTYRARNMIWCYDRWLCGDPTSGMLGELVDTLSTHHGKSVTWEFGTTIVYNDGRGAVFHQLELVTLPGRVALGADPVIWTSYSEDGETWSQERPCAAGKQGERLRRITWLRQGRMANWRIQRFRGTSDAHLAVARLEVQIEALNV